MKAVLVLLTCAVVAAALFLWFDGRAAKREDGSPEEKPADVKVMTPDTARANPGSRSAIETEDPGDETDEPLTTRPAVRHVPGSGPIFPIDITNQAPESLGKKPSFKLVTTSDGWYDLWNRLHELDGPRGDPLDDPTGPPPLVVGEEALLVIALGEQPRMDYAAELEPIESKYGEARYRFRVNPLAGPPVEVVTRPVRVYLLPTAPMKTRGLVVEDKSGYELARFDPPED